MPSVSTPRAVEVENLRKHFNVPGARPRGKLNRLAHPVQRGDRRVLCVLEDVTFDVQRGELFGIVGRNGSGKSTLLRILGSIYRPDAGRVRVTGSLAPFIELGVGFQPQMSARQNVAMNGVILGLGRREVRRRVDEVIAYAELEDFADVQLKNFSSGMRVRLAFASMLQADPDVYLIDEILAVGDEAFREKCAAEFALLKQRGKTILMVTHRLGILARQGDRAMLLADGRVGMLGDPGEVLKTYRAAAEVDPDPDDSAELERLGRRLGRPERLDDGRAAARARATIETLVVAGAEGPDVARIAAGDPIQVRVEAAASGWVHAPTLELAIESEDGTRIFVARDADRERVSKLKPGDRLAVEATIENLLTPGRYRLQCVLRHGEEKRNAPVSDVGSVAFEVAGDRVEGIVALERTVVLAPGTRLELAR